MSLHRKFASKQTGNPIWLAVAFVGFSFSLYGFYSYGYKPWSRRRMYAESREYANYIFQQENKNQSENEHFE